MSDKKPTYVELEARLVELEATIAGHKQTEKELQRFAALVKHSGELVSLATLDGKMVFLNEAGCRMLGISQQEIENVNIMEVIPDHLRELIGTDLLPTLRRGEVWEGDLQYKNLQTGNLIDVRAMTFTINDTDTNEPLFLANVSMDITERKQAEEALQRIKEAVDNTVDAIGISTPEGHHFYQNKAFTQMFGYTVEEVADLHPKVLYGDAEDGAAVFSTIMDGHAYTSECEMVSKDGSRFPIFLRANAIKNAEGEMIGLVGVHTDITERKQADERLRHLRNYLANIIDSMPSVLIGVDTDGNVTQWNNEARRTTGVSSKEAVGQSLCQAFPRLADEMERVRESMRTREVCSDPRRSHKESGKTHYEDVTIYPLISNGVEGAVIRVDNVTEQVRIEEMMVQSEKMLSVGGLAAGMAHEINNPLAGMMQNAEVMGNRLTKLEMPANKRAAEEAGTSIEAIAEFMEARDITRMLGHIRDSGKRAAEIVANMLSFARKSDSSFSTCDMANLLDQTVDLAGSDYDLKKKFDFRRIEIVREYEGDLPGVICEAGKIQQVLLNILRNGAEAMQEAIGEEYASANPCFVLRLKSDEKMVRIEIEDNGPGMDEATRKRVFEPFFTTKPIDEGTGLGLSVSYFIIAENHGGEMSVESILGKGAKFIIKLPIAEGRRP